MSQTPSPSQAETLKPCPFCGNAATIKDDSEECGLPTFVLTCDSADCFVAIAEEDADTLTELWNRRSSDAQIAALKAEANGMSISGKQLEQRLRHVQADKEHAEAEVAALKEQNRALREAARSVHPSCAERVFNPRPCPLCRALAANPETSAGEP